ncbi:zinc ribbon domain-containing protein [Actinokineospora sp. UTMC 2448]|uniref:zinc ribbon domain-containing protein n=1 Tax=Actinokineospora sp. UTMC 2448 TaxID=2268449 RepID=UPI002164712D|nr:C4-type zinc ribbon domain-containing protein [Actinokineospora sp. UTMC 2448]UVS77232.1 Putative zinc ribbon domain protein [Actinokineospora sp. UTMC 2448]
MKADPAVQRGLLDLAEVDAELNRIDHRRRTAPELAEIAEAEKAVRARRDARVAVQTQLDDLDREVARQEKEIDAVRAREERDRKLLDAGAGARQVADLEHELESLVRRKAALEDDLLELMERREAVEADGQHAAVELEKAEAALAEVRHRHQENLADLDSQQARRDADRAKLVATFPEPLVAQYERKRKTKGIGAALLRARRCGACRLELDRRVISVIKETAPDEVVECEECGVILVRTAESGL